MRIILVSMLVLSVAACGPRRTNTGADELPESYRAALWTDREISREDRGLPAELQLWKWDVLDPANILVTIQMRREISHRIQLDETRLVELSRLDSGATSGQIAGLEGRIATHRAKLDLIKRHLVLSPLPVDEDDELRTWFQTVVFHSTPTLAAQIRQDSVRRIHWLEGRITELETHHEDVVWPDYLHFNLLLHYEVAKVALIDRRPKG